MRFAWPFDSKSLDSDNKPGPHLPCDWPDVRLKAELQIGSPAQRIRKFDEPVRIFVDGKVTPERAAAFGAIVIDIGGRIPNIDLAMTDDRKAANFVVRLVTARLLLPTIRARFGNERARQIAQSLNPQCLTGIAKDRTYRIRRAEVILPADASDFTLYDYDCAYEELLQGLGTINDDSSLPWTMFNDEVQMGFFDIYDQLLLNILYDPRIRPGMTKKEVERLLPDILPAARDREAEQSGQSGRRADPSARRLTPGDRLRRAAESMIPPDQRFSDVIFAEDDEYSVIG